MNSISCSAPFKGESEGAEPTVPGSTLSLQPKAESGPNPNNPVYLSCAIIAWNEAASLPAMLHSLFAQSLFAELEQRGLNCELFCLANGCTDNTAALAEEIFQRHSSEHPCSSSFSCSVVNLTERGKFNAWNQFVHRLSAREARFLCLMDADILLHRKETIWNMLTKLEHVPEATVAVDRPCKDIFFKPEKSLAERLSLSMSHLTGSASAQLCAQLYCIRSNIARNIYLPRDLGACEDGFIKALVCTDFLSHEVLPKRIQIAEQAEHTFEAYTSLKALIRNQKRQALGQTIVHVLVDEYLAGLPSTQRANLARLLQDKDASDPAWLKRLIAAHLRRTRFFWRLYPGLVGLRLRRLANVPFRRKLFCLPAALAGTIATLAGSFLAYRALRQGCTDYWPSAKKAGLKPVPPQLAAATAISIHPK